MDITPQIISLDSKKLIGQRLTMSLTKNRTHELWRNFMPKRNQIHNKANNNFYSIQVYESSDYFQSFNPNTIFEKWAAIEVKDLDNIPEEMEFLNLEGGLYAVFFYKGLSNDPAIFQYIFTKWLPQSSYKLDNRPHFELLGEKYKNEDSNSEEEIWIPIKLK